MKEVAYEAEVPLLTDASLAKSLSANLAARWTEYSTSGAVWSWKAGLTWAVDDDLSLRAGPLPRHPRAHPAEPVRRR